MSSTANIVLRRPRMEDGKQMWQLVKDTKILDVNSAYCYLMMCKFFPDTCVVAEYENRMVGFVTAYRPPTEPDALFIWQIGVDSSQRGKGLGGALLKNLIERESLKGVRYITATISPSNIPSQKLFRRLAADLNANLEVSEADGMPEEVFPGGGHEAEPLHRIGPIRR